MAAKYTETCVACHGNSIAKGPVGPSLFDAEWLHGGEDDAIVKSIKDGYPEKGMPAFKDQMTDPSFVACARSMPSFEPEKSTPGMSVGAEMSAALHVAPAGHARGGGG